MPRSSVIAVRCARLSASIAQIIPEISNFARRVRDSRHDLNVINYNLLTIVTGLGIAQDDFAASASKLPASIVDAVSQVLNSCDETSGSLRKVFSKLVGSDLPNEEWHALREGSLINLRHDLDASKIVLELVLDYIALFGQQDTLDSLLKHYVSDLITASDDLLKRTDMEEIYVNQTARDRLPSLLQAIRLLRSCITAISREGIATQVQLARRTTTPRPDSLEPSLGESRRSGRTGSPEQFPSNATASKGIGTWLANVPSFEDAQPLRHSAIKRLSVDKTNPRPSSRSHMIPSRGTFYTDDGVSTNRTLVAPESRLRKTRSWCSDLSLKVNKTLNHVKREPSQYAPTISSTDISILHQKITSDKIKVLKSKRKELDVDQRAGVDRILANLPPEATAAEVERVLWEGANPMVTNPDFGFFFIRAAYEMSVDVVKALVDFGADITQTLPSPNQYFSAFHAATQGQRLDIVEYLASIGHSIDVPNATGATPLYIAVTTPGTFKVAKFLVDMGADVNHETKIGKSLLQAVLESTTLDGKERSMLIELLLAHGAEGEVSRTMEGRRGNSKGRSVLGLN